MKIHIIGRNNLDITPTLEDAVHEKLERLKHRFSTISTVDVTLHVENLTHYADATLHFLNHEIHASAKSEDMYAAIDELTDKLATQLAKLKEKITDHHR